LYQAQSINHLIAATTLQPTSATAFYHLAYCHAEARSIDAATESIRTAIELDQSNVQAWHLLALLLTSARDWSGAAKACEAGVSVWEAEEEAESKSEDEVELANPSGSDANVEAKDFAMITPHLAQPPVVSSEPLLLPTGAFKPLKLAPPTRLSRSRRLEQVIRLRMTLNVIVEKMQGPEIAMLRQQELFAFFSARSGKNRGQYGYSRGMTGAGADEASVQGLGGSFISVAETAPGPKGLGESMVNGESVLFC
jgi:tetratricopeptide (TPR) repeat protein